MSSSRRGALDRRCADLLKTPAACFECGKVHMEYVTGACKLGDGFVVEELTYLKCKACKAIFFDPESMDEIQKQRRLVKAR